MKNLVYPSNGFLGKAKFLAKNSEDFVVEFAGWEYKEKLMRLQFFLFKTGQDVGFFKFYCAFWGMLHFLAAHYFCMGMGADAEIHDGSVFYKFS